MWEGGGQKGCIYHFSDDHVNHDGYKTNQSWLELEQRTVDNFTLC